MDKRIWILFGVTFLWLSFFVPSVLADVGRVPMPGGVITTGDSVSGVEMSDETVIFDVRYEEEGQSGMYHGGDGTWIAGVTADFVMTNTTAGDISVNVFYPYPSVSISNPEVAGTEQDDSRNFVVRVNDQEVGYTYEVYDMEYGEGSGTQTTPSLVFPVTFAASSETEISVSYEVGLAGDPKSYYGSFIYVLATGSHWEGDIGSGEITFRFPEEIHPLMFRYLNDGFEMEGRELIWKFSNLEPTQDDNIRVSFCPEIFEIWNSRIDYLEDFTSSESEEMVNVYDYNLIPEGYDGSPGMLVSDNSPAFLLDPLLEDDDDYYPNWGWVVAVENGVDPWLNFEFDGTYELDGFQILSGIPTYLYNESTYADDEFLNFYNRAKTVKLTFSDGSIQEVEVPDALEVFAEVSIDTVETSSVKIEFVDFYPNAAGGGTVLGVRRLSLDVGDKVPEPVVAEPEQEETPSLADTEDDETWWSELDETTRTLVYLGAAVVVIIVSCVSVYFVKSRIKGNSKKVQDGAKTQ